MNSPLLQKNGGCADLVGASPTPSLQARKACYARARQSNYAASLRLEGFVVTPADAERKLPSRESVLSAYRARQD